MAQPCLHTVQHSVPFVIAHIFPLPLLIFSSKAVLTSAINTARQREETWRERRCWQDQAWATLLLFIHPLTPLHLATFPFMFLDSWSPQPRPGRLFSSSSHKGRLVWVCLTGQIEVSLLPLLTEGNKRTGGREGGGCKEKEKRGTCKVKMSAGMREGPHAAFNQDGRSISCSS